MSRYSSLLFDVDGTLLDFGAAEERGLTAVFQEYGAGGYDTAKLTEAYRKINRELWTSFEQGQITMTQLKNTRFQAVFQQFRIEADPVLTEKRYREFLNSSAIPVSGAEEVLKYLQPRYRLYVVTNGFSETQRRRMAASGLHKYFRSYFISEEAGFQKPQKQFFDYCLERMDGASRTEAFIIGDSLDSDIRGGNASGIDTCWFNPSGAKHNPQIHADKEIRSLSELMTFL